MLEKHQTIPQPGVLPKEPRLSVCMIVRHEEKMLPRCLKSVQSITDELIVVDTGSKDSTISIAKDFGAEVYHFKWRDDFAAARNESLKHATGDWILQMDADEELLASSLPPLRKAMLNPWCLVYVITCDNGATSGTERFVEVGRLFRNHPLVRYSRPYHEMVTSSAYNLIAQEPQWQWLYEPRIIIRHYGYEASHMNERNKEARALRIMESYIEKNPHDGYILTKLGQLYSRLKQYDKAAGAFEQAIAIDANDPDTHLELGPICVERGMLDEAIAEYKKAIAINPKLADAHKGLGITYFKKGILDQAITEFKKAIAINPKLADAHKGLGITYFEKGMFDQAITEFKKAIAINPKLADAHNNLGMAYYAEGLLDKAISEYMAAIAIEPNFVEAHYNLGVAYGAGDLVDDEISEYKKALAINPNLAEAHSDLGVAYADKGMLDEAVAEYTKALAINPKLADAHVNLGLAYRQKGMVDDAITEFEKAIAIDPENGKAHFYLAVTYYAKKRYRLAVQHCDKAVELGFKVHPGFLQDLKVYR